MSSPTLDGHAASAPNGGSSQSITLSTSNVNDIIVVVVFQENTMNTNPVRTVTGVSGGGLTWAQRSGISRTSVEASRMEIWWALAASPLSSTSITITLDGTTDCWGIVAFGVSGCNTSSPWDINVSLTAWNITASSAPSCTISTTFADDLIIAGFGDVQNNATVRSAVPTGFTQVDGAGTSAGALFGEASVASMDVTAVQTSLAVAWGAGSMNTPIYFVDALTADSLPAGAGSASGSSTAGGVGSSVVVPVIDGHAAVSPNSGSSQSITLSTTNTNDIIVVVVFQENSMYPANPIRTVTGVSGGGLTWAKRSAINRTDISERMEIWWALAAAALSTTSITITLDGTTDGWGIVAFGVSNCNPIAPWDDNASLTKWNNTASSAPSCTISTTRTNDLIIASFGDVNDNSTTRSAVPTGFTQVDGAGAVAPHFFAQASVASKSVTAVQTNLAVAWGAGTMIWPIYFVDALTTDLYPLASGSSSAGGVGTELSGSVGSASGSSSAGGVGAELSGSVGSASGSSSAGGVGQSVSTIGTGSASGGSAASGTSLLAHSGGGSATGDSSASGVGMLLVHSGSGSGAGSSSASGVSKWLSAASGTILGGSAALAMPAVYRAQGASSGDSSASASGQAVTPVVPGRPGKKRDKDVGQTHHMMMGHRHRRKGQRPDVDQGPKNRLTKRQWEKIAKIGGPMWPI